MGCILILIGTRIHTNYFSNERATRSIILEKWILISFIVWIIYFVFSWSFYSLEFLAKPTFSYMIIYAKTHNFVNHRFLGFVRSGNSTLICFILKAHLQAEPKVYKSQTGIGLMYGTYVLRIWKKNLLSISYSLFKLTLNAVKCLLTCSW